MIIIECQKSDSASSSKFHHLALLVALVSHSSNFHHWPLLALLVALVLHKGDSADLNFAILYMIIGANKYAVGATDTQYVEQIDICFHVNTIITGTTLSSVSNGFFRICV